MPIQTKEITMANFNEISLGWEGYVGIQVIDTASSLQVCPQYQTLKMLQLITRYANDPFGTEMSIKSPWLQQSSQAENLALSVLQLCHAKKRCWHYIAKHV